MFLPVNNALSDAGHVASFLEQLGNGVQHVATRVDDLLMVVRRANLIRRCHGEGLAFLAVPRSYYGDLASADVLAERARVDDAAEAYERLLRNGLVDEAGVVALECDAEKASEALSGLPHCKCLAEAVALSRYYNVHLMLGDRFDEKTYVGWVRERVLVDVQGDDVLLQIFTRPILQANANEEAPFLEFIQRVCSARELPRPGCGGFGIRNFLVLFLSIELASAAQRGDAAASSLLRRQLAESNPILADIADAAAREADLRAAGRDAAGGRRRAPRGPGAAPGRLRAVRGGDEGAQGELSTCVFFAARRRVRKSALAASKTLASKAALDAVRGRSTRARRAAEDQVPLPGQPGQPFDKQRPHRKKGSHHGPRPRAGAGHV